MRLDGTTAVVTGASSGLGRAMAGAFVAEGAAVTFAARSGADLEAAVEEALADDPPGDAIAVEADVRDWESVHHLFDVAEETLGPTDVLVNNAGTTQNKLNADHVRRPVPDVPLESWETVMRTNVGGAFRCARRALPGMLERDAGRLLHVSSGHGVSGRANRSPYVASKFALEGLQECLALELEGTGVDSLAIRPPDGGVHTERSGRYGRTLDSYTHDSPTVIAETAVRLAAGEGENGGRYRATPDGEDYVPYTRAEG